MKHDYEIIDGKPHFGIWFGEYIRMRVEQTFDEYFMQYAKDVLNNHRNNITPHDLKNRHEEFILKQPSSHYGMNNPLNNYATLAIKFMIWGRAFKVMKLNKKNAKRYAKRRISGRQRWVRIDKQITCV